MWKLRSYTKEFSPALRLTPDRVGEVAGASTRFILRDRFKLLTDDEIEKLAGSVVVCAEVPKSKL
jgi:hypothetical protein